MALPGTTGTDTDVTLTATISLNQASSTKDFNLKVLKDTGVSDQKSVDDDKQALTATSIIFAQTNSPGFVSQDFMLPTSGANRTTIKWKSDKAATISINDGIARVTRSSIINERVILTATISKGSASDSKNFTVTVVQADSSPDAPTNLTVMSQDTTSVQLSWNESADTGTFDDSDAIITAYTVYYSETSLAVVDLSTISTTLNVGTTNPTSVSVTGLNPNTTYYFVVTATNSATLESSASDEVNQTTDLFTRIDIGTANFSNLGNLRLYRPDGRREGKRSCQRWKPYPDGRYNQLRYEWRNNSLCDNPPHREFWSLRQCIWNRQCKCLRWDSYNYRCRGYTDGCNPGKL